MILFCPLLICLTKTVGSLMSAENEQMDWGASGDDDTHTTPPVAPEVGGAETENDSTVPAPDGEHGEGDGDGEEGEGATPVATRRIGQCTSWHAQNGWGFVRCLDTDDIFFCHCTDLRPTLPPLGKSWYKPVLYTGEYVEFDAGINSRSGKPACFEVTGMRGGSLIMDHGILKYLEYREERGTKRPRGEAGVQNNRPIQRRRTNPPAPIEDERHYLEEEYY